MTKLMHLFGYGSLIGEPEFGNSVIESHLGRLCGYSRVFNKISPARGCTRCDAFDAFTSDVPDVFRQGQHNPSLAVGTQVEPDSVIHGLLLGYDYNTQNAVLETTDAREGYDAAADVAQLGYLRDHLDVQRPQVGDCVGAWVYLSNPGGPYHLESEVSLTTRAKILINATPRPNSSMGRTGRALGLKYLESIRLGLLKWGVIDLALEQVVEAVYELDGPWLSLLKPPTRA